MQRPRWLNQLLIYASSNLVGQKHFHHPKLKIYKPCFTCFSWISICMPKTNRSSHQRCAIKKVFLGISQNSQENTCVRVSFLIKLQASAHFFYRTPFFTEHFWITASESSWFINSYLKYSRLKNSAIWLADRIFEDDQLGIYKPSFTFPESVSACQKSSWFILIFLKYSWFKNPTIWMA